MVESRYQVKYPITYRGKKLSREAVARLAKQRGFDGNIDDYAYKIETHDAVIRSPGIRSLEKWMRIPQQVAEARRRGMDFWSD